MTSLPPNVPGAPSLDTDSVRCLLCAGSHPRPPVRVGHTRDSCEWEPSMDRACNCADVWHAEATLIVGADGQWRLCVACAALPEFARFKVRRMIE